jgi:hypothetical protein
MQIFDLNLWKNVGAAILYHQKIPQEYHVAIAPLIHQFAIHNNYTWLTLGAILMAGRLVMIKLGRRFLTGIKSLPFAFAAQKNFCIVIEALCYAALLIISLYAAAIAILGLIWFQEFGFIIWIAQKFLPGWLGGMLLGMLVGIIINRIIGRKIEPIYSKKIDAGVNKKDDDLYSDVREVYSLLAQTKEFNPLNYFKDNSIFFGCDEYEKPIYIEQRTFFASHIQIMGCTGSGKGVAAACLAAQLIRQHISVIIFDPKRGGDEWTPHVLKTIAEQNGIQFHLLNLQDDKPQINLLKNISQDELNELLQAGMGIQDIGSDSDYYRRKDRKAALAVSNLAGIAECLSHLLILAMHKLVLKMEEAESFHDQLETLAQIPAVRTTEGLDLKQAIENGDCIYIIGTDSVPQIQLLQKMILLRIKQIIERRDRLKQHRHVTVILNELKCFLTQPVLLSLAMIRDHGCNFIVDHQAPGDLFDVSNDMSGKAVYGGIINNTNIKLVYKLNDPDDQLRISKMTGQKTVQRDNKAVITNRGMGELIDTDKKHIIRAKEPLYPANVFGALKPRVGVLIGVGLARLCFTSPIKTTKTELQIEQYPICPDYPEQFDDEDDVTDIQINSPEPVAKTESEPEEIAQFAEEKPPEIVE